MRGCRSLTLPGVLLYRKWRSGSCGPVGAGVGGSTMVLGGRPDWWLDREVDRAVDRASAAHGRPAGGAVRAARGRRARGYRTAQPPRPDGILDHAPQARAGTRSSSLGRCGKSASPDCGHLTYFRKGPARPVRTACWRRRSSVCAPDRATACSGYRDAPAHAGARHEQVGDERTGRSFAAAAASRAAHKSCDAACLVPGLASHLSHSYDVGVDPGERRSQPWNLE